MKIFADMYKPDAKAGRFLSVLALSGIAYGLYKGIQDNYLAEILRVSAFERGIVEFFRELPGLLVVVILAWMYRFTESRIFKIGTMFMMAGMAGLLIAGNGKFVVVLFMVIFSFGEHISMPVKTSITLDMAKREQGGAALGITSAIGNLGNIAGYLLVTAMFFVFARLGFSRSDVFPYKMVFAAALVLMAGAVIVVLAMRETAIKVPRRRFYFAKKYGKYYMLEVFYGARKQIFLTFAPYVLILQYGADTSTISLLLAICAIFGFLLSPFVGKLIDKVGYKIIMVSDTLILVVVCLLYGFSHRLFPMHIAFTVVCVNYILDSIISLASMATNVYVRDISSSQEEVTATISTGISVNHVISIFIALMGGWIWKVTGIEVLFSISAFLGVCNSLYAMTIKPGQEKMQTEVCK